jgi:drug/metabolite transporter (DMT)-like permease
VSAPVSHLRAIGYALAGFTLWVFTDACIKLGGEASIPPYEIVGFIGMVQVLAVIAATGRRGNIGPLKPRNVRHQLLRAILVLVNTFCNAIAVKHMPLTSFYVIIFTAPMVIAILAAFFLREHLDRKKIIAVLAGFGGVVYAINPAAPVSSGDLIGYAALFFSVLAYSVNTTWLRVMTQAESLQSLVFFSGAVEAIAAFIPMLWHFEQPTIFLFIILLAAGILNFLGNFANYKSLQHTTAANVSQFHYTQIITGALLGYLIWHDVPGMHLIIGAVIIIAAGLYIAAHARKTDRAPLAPA